MGVEYYQPSFEEKAQGSWAVVCERLNEDGEPDLSSTRHVIPTFDSMNHRVSALCICGPKWSDFSSAWVHGVRQ